MDFDAFIRNLEAGLGRALPGAQAQLLLAPRPRFGWRPGHAPDHCRASGVLLLLVSRVGVAHLVLTVRQRDLRYHAGQVSLPGGAAEPGERFERAALREAHEEIGLEPGKARLLGALSPLHVPVSDNVLHPRIAVAGDPAPWVLDPREVDRVLEVAVDELFDRRSLEVERRTILGQPAQVPFFRLAGEKVWGATAMVLAEFACLAGVVPAPPWPDRGPAAQRP